MREPIKGFGLLSDFALRKARSVLARDRLTRAHPVLAREAASSSRTRSSSRRASTRSLRRHGKNIAEMQYTQKRVADIAIDLYAIVELPLADDRARSRSAAKRARAARSICLTCSRVPPRSGSQRTSPRSTTTTTSSAKRSRTRRAPTAAIRSTSSDRRAVAGAQGQEAREHEVVHRVGDDPTTRMRPSGWSAIPLTLAFLEPNMEVAIPPEPKVVSSTPLAS